MERHNARAHITKFADIASLNDESIDLTVAALAISADEYPGLDFDLYLDKIEQTAAAARAAAAGLTRPSDVLQAINSVLFVECGYHGNRENYYDPRNSYLNQVIDRRTGIPITLSIIYMAVADRVGCPVQGVGMPGHFLVKLAVPSSELYIDPFNGGRFMDAAACERLAEKISEGRLELRPEHLSAVTKKQILTRMLANLLRIYSEASDYGRAIRTVDRILMIESNQPGFIRDRGLLLAANGQQREATRALERYLRLSPDAPDAASVRNNIKDIRAYLSRLN